MKLKEIMKVCLMVCVLLLCIITESFGFGTNKFEKEVEIEKSAIKFFREVERGGYGVISTEELKEAISKDPGLLVVDTMPFEASYAKGHVPGAVQFLFPIKEMVDWDTAETDGRTQQDFEQLLGPDKHKKIVVYCGFVKCTRSHNGAMWAVRLGYTNVYRHPGGIYAWKGMRYEMEKEE